MSIEKESYTIGGLMIKLLRFHTFNSMNFKTEEQEREQEQEQEDGCLTKWIMKKIRSCLQLFKNDHLIQAYHLLRTCDACTENFSSPQKIFITQFQQNHPEFQQIRVIGKQVTNLLELLNGIQINLKVFNNSIFSFRIRKVE
jgi:hypothetical protein